MGAYYYKCKAESQITRVWSFCLLSDILLSNRRVVWCHCHTGGTKTRRLSWEVSEWSATTIWSYCQSTRASQRTAVYYVMPCSQGHAHARDGRVETKRTLGLTYNIGSGSCEG